MLDTLLLDLGGGVKVGLTGVTELFEDSYEHKHGFRNRDTITVLQEAADELRAQGATVLVLLSHLGDIPDQLIAEAGVGPFDLIIGGHSHTVIEQPRGSAGTFIVQAGALGRYVGEVTLELEEETGRVFGCSGFLHVISEEMADDPAQASLFGQARTQADTFFAEVLTTLERPLSHKEFVTLKAESMRAHWKAEIGLMVGAAALDGVPAGQVTRGMVFQNCRSMILPVKTEISGARLLDLIRESSDPKIYARNVYGNGIRPNPLPIGKVYFAGVTWREQTDGQFVDVQVNGEPLQLERLYVAGIGSILLYPWMGYYSALEGCPLMERETFRYSKDVLIDYLRAYVQSDRLVKPNHSN